MTATNNTQIYKVLMEIKADIGTLKQRTEDIKESISIQKQYCDATTQTFTKDIDSIKMRMYMGMGALSAIIVLLKFFGLL